MLDVTDVFTDGNAKDAIKYIMKKGEGMTSDGVKIADLQEFWKLNHERVNQMIIDGQYEPGNVRNYEITNAKGKRRTVSSLCAIDRILTRMMAKELQEFYERKLSDNCFAYRSGIGVQDVIQKICDIIEKGNSIVVSIDIKSFFDRVVHKYLLRKLAKDLSSQLLALVQKYMQCLVEEEEDYYTKSIGVIQGNPMSPVLSNVYMMDFDIWLESKRYLWVRYADNIFLFFQDMSSAKEAYDEVVNKLKSSPWKLAVNLEKSGVYRDITECRFLGYSLSVAKNRVEIRKPARKPNMVFSNWHPCTVSKVNQEYHVLQNGILNKKDYALLFENEREKHFIPVETADQINVYSGIQVTTSVMATMSQQGIRMVLVDKYGNLLGHFVPNEYGQSGATTLDQCRLYLDSKARLEMARAFELANIHNMRAMLRYYKKKERDLSDAIHELTECMSRINIAKTVDAMMLIEGRAKQTYYSSFNLVLQDEDFRFAQRTRRPPQDELNAMISFGNVLLYNLFLRIIWKSTLDPRIGVVHATNRRSSSLNLDFADVFKPIVVDRIIFSLINHHRLDKTRDFVHHDDGVYMSDSGKRTFLGAFDETIGRKIDVNGIRMTYRRLFEKQVFDFQSSIHSKGKFRPYKYY